MSYIIEYRARPGDSFRAAKDANGNRREYERLDEAEKVVENLFRDGIVARVVDARYRQ